MFLPEISISIEGSDQCIFASGEMSGQKKETYHYQGTQTKEQYQRYIKIQSKQN